jgi:uncharacterized protein (DUF1015 family)
MHIHAFQAVYPNLDYITSPDLFFNTVREEYPEQKASGIYQRAASEGMYIYQIQEQGRSFTGVVACADIQDYFDGRIKKHEHTLASKEQQQLNLLMRRQATIKPVLLTYPPVQAIEDLLLRITQTEQPFLSLRFEEQREVHTLWAVREGVQLQQLQQLFLHEVPYTYIADGHHRCSTMALMHRRLEGLEKERPVLTSLMSAFFASSELEILEFNRTVEILQEISAPMLVVRLSQIADIDVLPGPEKPRRKHEVAMLLDKQWYMLRWKGNILDLYRQEVVVLDVQLLNELVFERIMGIQDVRTDERVRYVEGSLGLDMLRERVIKDDHRVGFALYPVDMHDFMSVADAEQVLPPKSTWFEPRMRNGLLVQEIEIGK